MPDNRMPKRNQRDLKGFAQDATNAASSVYTEFRTLFFLFSKEKVFRYFMLIVLLMVISAFLYLFIEHERVIAATPGAENASFFDRTVTVMYWAIVTIATCGYGDISPGTTAGRIMVIFVLFLSVGSVSMFTANLASALTTKKMMERRGVMDLSNYQGHHVICGWKQAMDKLLDEIVFANPKINLKRIIIIANIEPDVIELFHQQFPAYQDISILRGEHYNENLLRKANIAAASEVFILADESSDSVSATEADSKTVMTAMTIRTISRDVHICAELLDAKFESYLKSAHVGDIIYTREYSKVLIASGFSQMGIAKVVNDLLNTHTEAFFATERIPESFIGKPYGELREYFRKERKDNLIGIIENVGSFFERKQDALREAQKTADVSKLIENLKKAKRLENNLPNLNPEDSFVVPDHSMAVLISRRSA